MSGPISRSTARDFSAAFCRRSALHVPIPGISRSTTNLGMAILLLASSLLLGPRIVGRVHEAEIARPHPVHLHHRFLATRPGEVRVVRRDRGEATHRQLLPGLGVELLADPDEE